MLITITITAALQLRDYSQTIQDLQSDKDYLESTETRQRRQIQEQRHEIKKLEDRLDSLEQDRDQLRNENDELQSQLQARAAEQEESDSQVQTASSNGNTSCVAAIEQTWPEHLQSGAKTVLDNENGQHDPNAISAVNHHPDGSTSRDFGCFQINDKSHAGFFASNDWSDPVANARYAHSIYEGRGDWTAWYAVAGILW